MKNIVLISLISVILISCKSKKNNGNVIERWENGNPKITKEFTNKSANSFIYCEYFNDGKLKNKSIYSNGILEGSSKIYNEEGYLVSEKKYDKGRLMAEYTYKFGSLNGPEKLYHPNGQLWTERILKNGRPWDVVSNFDSMGKPLDPGTLKDGYGSLKLYDDNGNPKMTVNYREGKEVINQPEVNREKK